MRMLRFFLRKKPLRLYLGLICGAVLLVLAKNFHWPRIRHIFPEQIQHAPLTSYKGGIRYKKSGERHVWQAVISDYNRNTSNKSSMKQPLPKSAPNSNGPIWQTVVADILWVYSAYLDTRTEMPVMKIFGMMNRKGSDSTQFMCNFENASSWLGCSGTSMGNAVNIDAYHSGTEFLAIAIQCALPEECSLRTVQTVSVKLVYPPNHHNLMNSIKVSLVQESAVPRSERMTFTICTSPIFFNYSDVGEFVEMIEVGRMFGADKFVVYDLSIGPVLRPYIEYYRKHGILQVHSWQLPIFDTKHPTLIHGKIHYFGQVIAINDCVYRNMYRSEYVAVTDLDEIIVPLKAPDWHQMIAKLGKSDGFDYSCVFFRKDWPNDNIFLENLEEYREIVNKLNPRTLLKTKREHKTWGHRSRSKEMVKPEIVNFYHIHFVASFINSNFNFDVRNVPEDDALLFHYRFWDDAKGPWTVNNRMHTFSTEILKRITLVYTTVNKSLSK